LVYLTVFAPGGMPYFNKKFNLNSYTMYHRDLVSD